MRHKDEEEEKHSDDEVRGCERRGRGRRTKSGMRGASPKNAKCKHIQGTLKHNHGNQTLNLNPSCSRYHGHLSIRTTPLHHAPSSSLSLGHLTCTPKRTAIIRLSHVYIGP